MMRKRIFHHYIHITRRLFNVMGKSKSGINPILVKCGLAVALTFAGFLYSHFRAKRIKPSITSPKGNLSSNFFIYIYILTFL